MAKKIRVTIEILFLLVFLLIFLDLWGVVPPQIKQVLFFFQVIPSLLHAFHADIAAAIGFVIILILTIMFGRVYCSTICPLGAMQDIVVWLRKKFKKKLRFSEAKNFAWMRYTSIGLALIGALTGFSIVLNVLDPFSVAGKITNTFFRPLAALSNNGISSLLQHYKIYSVSPVVAKAVPPEAFIIPGILLVLILVLVFSKERIFCNTICPVGGLLGLIANTSRMHIQIDKSGCSSCGVCEWKCKAGCIDTKTKKIDRERCVVCFDCIEACSRSAIHFKKEEKKQFASEVMESNSRRVFVSSVAGVLLLGALDNKKIDVSKDSTVPTSRKTPVFPPGGRTLARFNAICTGCQLCVTACPSSVLQPSLSEYGLAGIMQPVFNYKYSFCNFECTVCADVCPTGALQQITLQEKKTLQLGKAHFEKRNCIVETQGTDCGACSEHCPTKAVHMVPYKNVRIPEVTDKYCIGCGACEYACPVKPYKAIYVEGNKIHGKAELNQSKDAKVKQAVPEEFPF
jgi:ferredoxin